MASGPITSGQTDGEKMETETDSISLGSKITENDDGSQEIKRRLLLGRKAMTNLGSMLKKRHYSVNKGLYSQGYGFSSSHVWMWVLGNKKSWTPKNWCFQTVVLEKTLGSPLDSKEIKSVNPKGNQPWKFIERTDAKAEAPILWPLMQRADSLEKSLMLGRLKAGGEGDDRGWDGWMASPTQWTWVWWTLGVGDEQGGLVCCSSWGRKESDMTEQLNWHIIGEKQIYCCSFLCINFHMYNI